MSEFPTTPSHSSQPVIPQVIVQTHKETFLGKMGKRFLYLVLGISLMTNFALLSASQDYFAGEGAPKEKYHSGKKTSTDKIALIEVKNTIMAPYTERIIKAIKQAETDDHVKGAVLVIDSPGGLVTDSHQIYHRLQKLREKKPIFVCMQDIAASGGYYIAMGAGKTGKIYAEPTTWTGSIGVILPRYEIGGLADKLGIKSEPLKTGKFKDALNPFRPMTAEESALWSNIIDQAFQRFLGIIVENRHNMPLEKLKPLAQGQVFTAGDAKKNGLVDEIGFEEDAIEDLKKQLKLTEARVVKYETETGLSELLLGARMQQWDPAEQVRKLLEASVPRALYFCSSNLPSAIR